MPTEMAVEREEQSRMESLRKQVAQLRGQSSERTSSPERSQNRVSGERTALASVSQEDPMRERLLHKDNIIEHPSAGYGKARQESLEQGRSATPELPANGRSVELEKKLQDNPALAKQLEEMKQAVKKDRESPEKQTQAPSPPVKRQETRGRADR